VNSLPFLKVLAVLVIFVSIAVPQAPTHHFPTPPEPLDSQAQSQTASQPSAKWRLNLAQAQKEADDLARTAQTIPSDVASVRKGMLPKDVIEKLKQIEKLSKHLRTELNP